jgi:hypothetical protein
MFHVHQAFKSPPASGNLHTLLHDCRVIQMLDAVFIPHYANSLSALVFRVDRFKQELPIDSVRKSLAGPSTVALAVLVWTLVCCTALVHVSKRH